MTSVNWTEIVVGSISFRKEDACDKKEQFHKTNNEGSVNPMIVLI